MLKIKKLLSISLSVLFLLSITVAAVSARSDDYLYFDHVSLISLQLAAVNDPNGPQGAITLGAVPSVKIVEKALLAEGLLDSKYAYDGSYGTATIKAYQKWQRSLGSAEKYCDGIPGPKDLTKLGNKHGFIVSP